MIVEPNVEAEQLSDRPDPFFKLLTRLEAEQLGLKAIETELQFTTRADLVLAVPPGLNLEGTMFDFFRTLNVLEFKSENDKFNVREYVRNEVRTGITLLHSEDTDFGGILNVIVVSRRPRGFLTAAKKRRLFFRPQKGKPWLLVGQVGFQDVAIVVCRDLPLEKPYYNWLTFAPAGTDKWKEFVLKLLEEGNIELLEIIEGIRPKEFLAMLKSTDILAELEAIRSKQDPELDQERAEVAALILKYLANNDPKKLGYALSRLKPEQRLADLTPEERAELLKLLTEQTKEEQS